MAAPSPTRLFLTGATGYIGGAFLHHLLTDLVPALPIHVTALVRQSSQANRLQSQYGTANLHTVLGTLDDRELLAAEAKKADVVLQLASVDHAASTAALLDGLLARESSRTQDQPPGIYIIMSGSASTIDLATFTPGDLQNKVYGDITDRQTILDFPQSRMHVTIERDAMTRGEEGGVKVVVLAPNTVYADAEPYGLGKQGSFTDEYIKAVLQRGKGFVMGKGEAKTHWSSTRDLARCTGLVLADLVNGEGKIETGTNGFYFLEQGEVKIRKVWETVIDELAKSGKIREEGKVLDTLSIDEANSRHPMGAILWGFNLRAKAERFEQLGWRQDGKDDWEEMVRGAVRRVVSEGVSVRLP